MQRMKTAIALAAGIWAASFIPGSILANDGVRQLGRYSVAYEGPDLRASVGFSQAAADVGDEWLILVVQLTAPSASGNLTVSLDDIHLRTPDGGRLQALNQAQYRGIFGKIRIRLRQALTNTSPLLLRGGSQRPCGYWFVDEPGEGFGREELPINSFSFCAGPLVFRVPGSVQPGRWRLVIDLEESRADIPFEIEDDR
jgi:hypothetical protein